MPVVLWLLLCMQIIDVLFEKDPNGACLAFYDMMKKQILMPAHMMDDGEHHSKTGRNLFAVSSCAQLGITYQRLTIQHSSMQDSHSFLKLAA